MAQTIFPTEEAVEQYKELTNVLELKDFDVVGVERDEESNSLSLLCAHRWPAAICPECGNVSQEIHDYPDRRRVRDLAVAGRHCWLEFDSRRFMCRYCGSPFTERLANIEFNRTYTRRYETRIVELCCHRDLNRVAADEGLGYKKVEDIWLRAARRQVHHQAARRPLIRVLGVDEISKRKYPREYALVLSDLERNCVVDMLPDRLKSSLEAWFDDLSPEERAHIEQVAMDLWEPYRLAVQAKLPQADIVADRFHIMHDLNKVIHKARRAIQRQAPEEVKDQLKGLRWTLVKNESNLKDQERQHLVQLKICYPQMYQLYCLRQDFHCLFEDHTDPQTAEDALEDWIRQAEELNVKPLQTFIATLRNWWQPILNFFKERVTSGFVEGINNKIKLIKRITFGMPNFEHFRLRVLFEFG